MRDYWLTQEILRASGFGFLALALLGIGLALWLPKTRTGKTWAFTVVATLIAIPMSQVVRGVVEAKEFEARSDKARAMWQERCKTAGEKIYKTVENVEGIYLMKIRTSSNHSNQFELDDPYGHDSTGDMYLLNFLRGFYHQRTEALVPGSPPRVGYSYVEAEDAKDGQRYRYTGRLEEPWQTNKAYSQGYNRFVLDRALATGPVARYGIAYDGISTHEEREYWLAGSSLKVIDFQTNEVIAERIGYMVDLAQGSRAGQRSPWLFAANSACPGFQWNPNFPITASNGGGSSQQPGQTITFVEKVLKPSK
ncbi:hypothetical protein [Aquabacterium sp.]|uniref:hypothetical protein n=1 Tax=Aquabacterium sp. TaxID=1872578 RepID=UPI0019B6A98C|nr:hypothetical protein [Aquabacterium sp.]MBC7700395.1 hypothetical protein [Aquabacterium sp.]